MKLYSLYPELEKVEQFSDVEQLQLLIPWDLPMEMTVNEDDRIRLTKCFQLILQALESCSYQEELKLIDKALFIIGEVDVYLPQIKKTKVPLEVWEVDDYNKYFGINHVRAKNSTIVLVRSLLITYQRFVQLIIKNDDFEPQQLEMQRAGFVEYVYLLTRVFDLSVEKTNE